MTKVDVYNSDYTKLNHAYIVMYEMYEKLIQCEDADEEILLLLESILRPLNPALDKIKSEMTVKTRYKEENSSKNEKSDFSVDKKNSDGVILRGNFTGE